jgi:hypothetical protein
MDAWKLQDAKARFNEVVDRALRDGPQLVTRHGENAGVGAGSEFQGLPVVDSACRPRHQIVATPSRAHRALSEPSQICPPSRACAP